ncbi:MAG: hypothetical protein FJW34_16615 [Acidobacteria bacterium]|nr:hypothetical protein [Acidobacteriota bacterium]
MLSDIGPHASEDALEGYAVGFLGEAEAESLEEHLLVCNRCQDRLVETEAFIRATRQAARNLPAELPEALPARAWRLPRLVWGPALAGVVVLLGISGWWGLRRHQDAPPVAVALEALRGDSLPAARAPSGRTLLLRVDLNGLPDSGSFELDVVSAQGRLLQRAVVPRAGTAAQTTLAKLEPGQYWVRLYDQPRRGPLREFGLRVE